MGNIFGYHCDRSNEAMLEDPAVEPNKKLTANKASIHYANSVRGSLPDQRKSASEEETKLVDPDRPRNDYEQELRPFAVRSVNLRRGKDDFEHCFSSSIKTAAAQCENSIKTSRLLAEIKILARNLPISLSNSIFLVYDDSRMDVMKAGIVGAEDTPYANGFFVYDIYCDEGFPSNPPKVNLMTTGGGKVRFNPNLYSNGYICLSLLGTWSGDAFEKWTVKSNLLQILLSIQAIVMSEGVLYNEPGHQKDGETDIGKARNRGYSNIVRLMNIKHAMIGQLKNVGSCFREPILGHFRHKRDLILETCEKWLQEEKEGRETMYDGLVELHNKEIASKYKADPKKFGQDLAELIAELRSLLFSNIKD